MDGSLFISLEFENEVGFDEKAFFHGINF